MHPKSPVAGSMATSNTYPMQSTSILTPGVAGGGSAESEYRYKVTRSASKMLVQVAPGVIKETNNPLLLKAEIGKPLKRGFTLPPAHFTYGKSSQGKMSGCAEALANWNSNVASLHVNEKKPQRDFIRLNKAATTSGLVTAQEQAQFRATHEIIRDNSASKHGSASLRRLPPTMVFGVPTKPSTPVFDLLEHKYQDRWLNERRKAELNRLYREEAQAKSTKSRCYSETRASKLRRYSPPVDPPPLWQMSKFKKVLPALQTFRSDDERAKAFEHHASDCTARTGVFGHGNYEQAKS